MAATNVQAFPGDVVIPGKQYAIELQADLAEADKSATTWYRLLKGGLRQGSDGYSTKCELLVHASGLHECVTFDFNYMIQLVGAGGCGLNVYRHDSFFSRVGIVKFRLTEYANYVFYLDMKIDHDVVGVDRTWTVNLKVVQGGSAVEAPTTFLEKITSYTNIVAHREYDIGLSAFAVMPTSNAAPFTIMSTGNVGIGVTAPLNALHVSSDNFATFARGTGSAGWSGIRLGIPYTTNHDAYCSVIESYNDAASNYSSILRFKTSSGDNAAATERMCIDSVGNVGIGTTTPKQPLEVKTTAVVSGRFGVGTVLTSAQNGGGQDIWNLGTAARLVVRCLNNSDTTASYANAKAYAGIALVPGFDAADTTNMGLWGTGSGENPRFYIQNMINNGANGGNSILLQPVAGSVGIGTISPGYTLDVNGTIGATSGIIYGTGSDGIFTVKNTNTPAIVRLITSGNQVYFQSGTAMSTNSRADINFTSMYAAYTYLKINGSNGYIGHGTASPASRMHHKQPADQGGGAGLGSYQNGLILERS